MLFLRSRILKRVLACGAALAVLIPAAALAGGTTVACSPTKMKMRTSNVENTHQSTTSFQNIPETAITFTQGGAVASCVVVRFSAVVAAVGAKAIEIRAFLDDTTAALPGEAQYSGSDGLSNARSFDFIFPSVAPGNHTLRMQYRSGINGDVYVHRHNTIVQYVP